jgi:VanZ family protein
MNDVREPKNQGPRERTLLALWLPVLAWMAVIFFLSAQSSLGDMQLPPLFGALRKSGHIFEYAVLALLLGRALLGTWRARGEKLSRTLLNRVWWVGAAAATLYGITDEFHQTFVPKRGGYPTDVLIDALAAIAALGIWNIIATRKLRGGLRGGAGAPLQSEPARQTRKPDELANVVESKR